MTESTKQPGYTPPDVSLLGDEHVQRYIETSGAVGHEWNGAHCLLLTTKGRKSGEMRTVPLIYGQDGDNYLVVASKGGADTHPVWYLNLSEHPEVEVQVLGERFSATARTAGPDEKERLWKIMTVDWPNYDVYQTRTEREIPLVVIEPK